MNIINILHRQRTKIKFLKNYQISNISFFYVCYVTTWVAHYIKKYYSFEYLYFACGFDLFVNKTDPLVDPNHGGKFEE